MLTQKQHSGSLIQCLMRRALSLGAGVMGIMISAGSQSALAQSSEIAVPSPESVLQRIENFFLENNFFRGENDPPNNGMPRGSRDLGGLCLISPSAGQALWHRRPLLIWQGPTRVAIRSAQDNTILWQAAVNEPNISSQNIEDQQPDVFIAPYQGEPLAPGGDYEWIYYVLSPSAPARWFAFQSMEAEPYEHHAGALATLRQALETAGADEEAIALAKVNYFIDHDLPSDALQVLYTVSDPSEGFLEARQNLVEALCSPPPGE